MVALKSTRYSLRRGDARKPRLRLGVVRSEKYVKPVRIVTSSGERIASALRETRIPDRTLITSHQQVPNWLRMLIGLERCVSVVTIALGTATLTVYGLTVSSGQQWSRDYNRLQGLQRYERQVRVANEVLKNQIAEQAEHPGTDLVPQNPTNTIFLPPASEGNSSAISPIPSATASKQNMPLGY